MTNRRRAMYCALFGLFFSANLQAQAVSATHSHINTVTTTISVPSLFDGAPHTARNFSRVYFSGDATLPDGQTAPVSVDRIALELR